jgi:hypothetical protein
MPGNAVGTTDPVPTFGAVTLFTNDPANHRVDIPASWTWQQVAGTELPAASAQMFVDFGDIPQGASRDRTFEFDFFGRGSNGVVHSVTTDSIFSLRTPNPNPFVADGFPVEQANEEVPLTFTIRSTPNAATGSFQGIASIQSDDADEPLIEVLVVAYGAPPHEPLLPSDLAVAFHDESSLVALDGSELTLVSIDAGSDGLERDEATGVVYMYSSSAFAADPAAPPSEFDSYVFRVPVVGKPQIITTDLSDTASGLAVDFRPGAGEDLAYVLSEGPNGTDLVRITESGTINILAAVNNFGGNLVTDSAGNIYVSGVQQPIGRAITKYSPAGTPLLAFPNSDAAVGMETANDIIWADTGVQYDTSGNPVGSFTVLPHLWFTADGLGNVLFGSDSGNRTEPQTLTLELPDGTLRAAGQLQRRAEKADF